LVARTSDGEVEPVDDTDPVVVVVVSLAVAVGVDKASDVGAVPIGVIGYRAGVDASLAPPATAIPMVMTSPTTVATEPRSAQKAR
jgi:hypothetical protein